MLRDVGDQEVVAQEGRLQGGRRDHDGARRRPECAAGDQRLQDHAAGARGKAEH